MRGGQSCSGAIFQCESDVVGNSISIPPLNIKDWYPFPSEVFLDTVLIAPFDATAYRLK